MKPPVVESKEKICPQQKRVKDTGTLSGTKTVTCKSSFSASAVRDTTELRNLWTWNTHVTLLFCSFCSLSWLSMKTSVRMS